MKIVFVVPYPVGESPSQRFRFEQYLGILSDHSVDYKVNSFLTKENWRVVYARGRHIEKLKAIGGGLLRRLRLFLKIHQFDFVFIHREAAPIGPPVFEWIIAKIFRKKIIYDFDDAIWLTDKKNERWLEKVIRWRSKTAVICRWSHKISAGNLYLAQYAARFNKLVIVNPTTIDTEHVHKSFPRQGSKESVVIGWTGSHSTLKYLVELEHVLQRIENEFSNVEFWVIADKQPQLRLKRLIFKPWSLETEVSDLAQFDIGIMPLPNDEWAKGKCGFKALQYMAMQIPTVASSVGVNSTIISHEVNGLLANSFSEWEICLARLIKDKNLRQLLGQKGKERVQDHYSVKANSQNFMELFDIRFKV